jgi:hypothetical protein
MRGGEGEIGAKGGMGGGLSEYRVDAGSGTCWGVRWPLCVEMEKAIPYVAVRPVSQ